MRGRKTLTTLLLFMGATSLFAPRDAMAEKRPLSKEELQETATHIVVGNVQAIYSRKERQENYEYTRYLAEVEVDKKEKGEGPDDLIYVRYFTISWKGPGQIPPGPSGHYPLPKHGGTYRFYLSRNAYDGFSRDGSKDGGFNVVYGNGAQPADSPQRTGADETKPGPRETFVKYFQAMEARKNDVAKALKAPKCIDNLHMNIHNLDIVVRLQPFYELSTSNQALVVAHPFTISRKVSGRDEVIYAQLAKQNGAWRLQKLARTSPENASSLMRGFQIHPDVKLDLSAQALVGRWWYPCDSTIVLKADGTGSELEVGPFAPPPDQKPEPFTWSVNGSTLIRRFANHEEQLVVSSIDHEWVRFETPNKTHHSGWGRRTPVTVTRAEVAQLQKELPNCAIRHHAKENLGAIPWQDFSTVKLKELRSQNNRILVIGGAEWDVTAKILERTLFTDRRVIDAVKQLNYVPLRADFTHPSDEIEGFIRDVGGRPGEATIVVFHGSKDEAPIVLQMKNASKFISTEDLLDAMKPKGKAKE